MTVAFSTSSPLVSVALISPEGAVIGSAERAAARAASGAALDVLNGLLHDHGRELAEATLFAADLGPGGFTSVRVGVTLAKTLAFVAGVPVAGADAFDLIDPERTVVVGATRGTVFLRRPGRPGERWSDPLPAAVVGYGPGLEAPVHPHASRFAPLLAGLTRLAPAALVPAYLAEPSISQPRSPFRTAPGHG